jgi:hypothetical protein
MGQRDQLPEHQLNVAESGALSTSMPDQARELVRRIKRLKEIDTWNSWALVIITIGTEEVSNERENVIFAFNQTHAITRSAKPVAAPTPKH